MNHGKQFVFVIIFPEFFPLQFIFFYEFFIGNGVWFDFCIAEERVFAMLAETGNIFPGLIGSAGGAFVIDKDILCAVPGDRPFIIFDQCFHEFLAIFFHCFCDAEVDIQFRKHSFIFFIEKFRMKVRRFFDQKSCRRLQLSGTPQRQIPVHP